MCILSILREEDNFILTHNRDEDVARITSKTLISKSIDGIEATYPLDVQAQGTWILTSTDWTTAILNGADELHKRILPYRHSRGLFPFMLLNYNAADDYVTNLNVDKIEPFTQILIHHKTQEMYTFMWDGKQKILEPITSSFFVLSSSTLYNSEEKLTHERAIKAMKHPNADELAFMHKKLSWQHNPDIPMLKTTSQVQIMSNYKNKTMKFTKFANE